jgi:hypothetical protein
VAGTHGEALFLVLGCLEALRRGCYELWKDTALGPRLAQLAPEPSRRRGKRRKPDSGGEASP